jgi:hypothetical protein
MHSNNKLALISLVCFLGACAGRQANPVQAIQSGDDKLSCEQIVAAMKFNTTEVKGLIGESSSTVGKNVAAGVAGAIIFFPALFFMDTKNAAGDEGRALVRRNQVLLKRHKLMECKPALEDKNTAEIIINWDSADKIEAASVPPPTPTAAPLASMSTAGAAPESKVTAVAPTIAATTPTAQIDVQPKAATEPTK